MDKTKQTLAIALAAVLVVVAGGWFLLISPQRSSVASLQTQKASVDTHERLAAAEDPAAQGRGGRGAGRPGAATGHRPAPAAEPGGGQPDRLAVQGRNRSERGPAGDHPRCSGARQCAGSRGSPWHRTTSAAADAGTAAAPAAAAPAANPNQLYALPLSLTVQGNYFDLEMFIHNLEGLQRAMLINT